MVIEFNWFGGRDQSFEVLAVEENNGKSSVLL